VWNNRLANVTKHGFITFYEVDFAAPEVLQVTQKECVDLLDEICLMDNEGNDLITCSGSGDIILWNFQTGEEVKNLETSQQFINDVIIKQPYVVVSIKDFGIKIYNFDLGTMIRDLPFVKLGWANRHSSVPNWCTSMQLTNMWLMICRNLHDATVELLYWPDLLQEAVAFDQVTKVGLFLV
jgi:WD40 repeat protein